MRFHAIVFASLAGVPGVAIPYDDKCRSFLKDHAMASVEPSTLTADAVLASPAHWDDERRRMKKLLPAAQVGVTTAVLLAVLRHVNARAAASAFAHASPLWVLLALAMNIVAVSASTALWRSLMLDTTRPYRSLWRAYLVGMFYNNLGLGTVLGDAYRYAHLSRSGDDRPAAAVSVLGERIVSGCVLVGFAALGRPVLRCVAPGPSGRDLAATRRWRDMHGHRMALRARGEPRAAAAGSRCVAARIDVARGARACGAAARVGSRIGWACCVQMCTVLAALFVLRSLRSFTQSAGCVRGRATDCARCAGARVDPGHRCARSDVRDALWICRCFPRSGARGGAAFVRNDACADAVRRSVCTVVGATDGAGAASSGGGEPAGVAYDVVDNSVSPRGAIGSPRRGVGGGR